MVEKFIEKTNEDLKEAYKLVFDLQCYFNSLTAEADCFTADELKEYENYKTLSALAKIYISKAIECMKGIDL